MSTPTAARSTALPSRRRRGGVAQSVVRLRVHVELVIAPKAAPEQGVGPGGCHAPSPVRSGRRERAPGSTPGARGESGTGGRLRRRRRLRDEERRRLEGGGEDAAPAV